MPDDGPCWIDHRNPQRFLYISRQADESKTTRNQHLRAVLFYAPRPAAMNADLVASMSSFRASGRMPSDRSEANLACTPNLVLSERACWRAPVKLAFPTTGPVGVVGEIDVDVQTGKVLADEALLQEIESRAADLARRHTPEAI